ncbi:MAG: penicillin-binding transpeptidase domain-containing protein [Solirubrobacteraceae bacterium]
MPSPIEDRRPPITPQLAVRVAVLGGLAFVLFAAIFFRLWFLQVLTGDDYVSQARDNRIRKVKIEAPRGNIVDRNGQTLVKTRAAPVVQILPNDVPDAELEAAEEYRKLLSASEGRRLAAASGLRELERRLRADGRRSTKAERRQKRDLGRRARRAESVPIGPIPTDAPELRALFRRLGAVIGVDARTIHRRVIQGIADQPAANITIKTDVPAAAFNYLLEHREEFPGVVVEKKYLRFYPYKKLGAQLFGTLREISPQERKLERYRGISAGTRIGKDGIEETYDDYLRGTDGFTRVIVDSLGSRDDTRRTTRTEPIQGRQLRLTLDLGLQRAANNAIKRAIDAANGNLNPASAGAYVAMDPRDGEVLALGSYPSFDANLFAKPIDPETFERLNSEENGAPLFNRAIGAAYPTGSTFKPVTAFAALDSGIITPSTQLLDTGVFRYGLREFKNAGDAVFGSLALPRAIQVSSDVFFYQLGARANDLGAVIQDWARKLSFGKPTGIDLPGEFAGLVPDREWRDGEFAKYRKCAREANVSIGSTEALYACGGVERGWSGGDNVNLAVGQGDLQATPLQLATAYAAIANGGKVITPHLGQQVEDGAGRQLEEIRKPAQRRIDFDPAALAAVRTGLRDAAGAPGGTSYDVMEGFPYPVYGKTGTAERYPNADQSWYAAYVDDPVKPIVVVVTVEEGGFGAEAAAPAARLILSKWFGVKDPEFHAGASATR